VKQYHSFIFDSYDIDPAHGQIVLRYSLDDSMHFSETISIPTPQSQPCSQSQPQSSALKHALSALHLFGGISYYKTFCPKNIEVRTGALTPAQADFWNTVYTKGLGEFFYRNAIDHRGLIQFPATGSGTVRTNREETEHEPTCKRVLLPLGGGKDSIVTLEMLRKSNADITLLRMNAHPLITKMAEVTGLPLLTVERRLAPELFELNAQGALNGHVPITGYLSALTTVVALIHGFDTIAMSNEKSANEGNTEYLGTTVNHQWSKSEEFERMFRSYLAQHITQDVHFINPLRTMTELEIVGEFVQYPQYFAHFTSCNRNWKLLGNQPQERWCRQCPKCAFAFVLLAAYLPQQQLEEIFGNNLFADASLVPLYRQLLGLEGCKPFECVGTAEETREAFRLAHERGKYEDTPAMQLYLSIK